MRMLRLAWHASTCRLFRRQCGVASVRLQVQAAVVCVLNQLAGGLATQSLSHLPLTECTARSTVIHPEAVM
jgi:hypothetical protein